MNLIVERNEVASCFKNKELDPLFNFDREGKGVVYFYQQTNAFAWLKMIKND